jgi:hypothetical protein
MAFSHHLGFCCGGYLRDPIGFIIHMDHGCEALMRFNFKTFSHKSKNLASRCGVSSGFYTFSKIGGQNKKF